MFVNSSEDEKHCIDQDSKTQILSLTCRCLIVANSVTRVPNFGKCSEGFSLDVFKDLKNIFGEGLNGKASATNMNYRFTRH